MKYQMAKGRSSTMPGALSTVKVLIITSFLTLTLSTTLRKEFQKMLFEHFLKEINEY